jgi:hypothetical protein
MEKFIFLNSMFLQMKMVVWGGGVAPKWLTGGEQLLGLDDFVPSPTSYIVSPETQTF